MKALMFGWEFPPHILGGLGTASFGLTRGMAMQPDMDITFCIPKPWGDEDQSFLKIVGVNQVPIVWKDVDREYVQQRVSKAGMNADQYYKYREINNYSIVAGVIARTEEYDIIHAHDWLTYPAGIHAKNVSGKPLVIHVHATDYDRSRGNVNPDVYAIEKNGMDNADHIITVSNLTRQTVIEKYHQDPAKVTTVHNAVEPLSPEILAITDKKGVKDKVITFLGRITMQKGPEYFVEAAAKVLAKAPYARFVMAGSGDMMDQMIRLAAARNISDRFHFTGFMKGKQVYEVLKASDVYVMPSVSEPFGISPLEAMQCGVPSIISKQSGCAEILDYAIKVDYWDIEALADAMYSIITYPAMHEFLKVEGKKEVDNIKWEYAGQKVRRIYDNVIGNK